MTKNNNSRVMMYSIAQFWKQKYVQYIKFIIGRKTFPIRALVRNKTWKMLLPVNESAAGMTDGQGRIKDLMDSVLQFQMAPFSIPLYIPYKAARFARSSPLTKCYRFSYITNCVLKLLTRTKSHNIFLSSTILAI